MGISYSSLGTGGDGGVGTRR